MPYLEVSGATLCYEQVGKGPTLLCIHGGNGSYDPWKGMADALRDHFTVVIYDRKSAFWYVASIILTIQGRGFSRSGLTDSQDYAHRLETDADDAARLIKHVSSEPAYVIGNSSGAIVSLMLLVRHPDSVKLLMPHETPLASVLPDFKNILEQLLQPMYDTYRKYGHVPAMQEFMVYVKAGDEWNPISDKHDPVAFANLQYWFEREFLPYPQYQFDLDDLSKLKDKMRLLVGGDSNPEAPQYRANVALAEKLAIDVYTITGAHFGFASHTQPFAKKLREIIEG